MLYKNVIYIFILTRYVTLVPPPPYVKQDSLRVRATDGDNRDRRLSLQLCRHCKKSWFGP